MAGPSDGLDYSNELDQKAVFKSTRTIYQKIDNFLMVRDNALMVLLACAGATFALYAFAEVGALCSFIVGCFTYKAQNIAHLPIMMPRSAACQDPGNPKRDGTPGKSEGIIYLGNEWKTRHEIWISNDQARTHILTFGTTGSGKTEQLLGLVFNSLVHDSGFIFVDGKGTSELYAKIYKMARLMGRDDDVLLVNFQTGGKDIFDAQTTKLSNTLNPFAMGSSGMLSQLSVGLIQSGEGGGGDVWENRAISFVEALMTPLVYLRDYYGFLLDVAMIRSFFTLPRIEELVHRYPKEYPGLEKALDGLNSYLENLPGYNEKAYQKQSETALEQHGYITMQLVRAFGSLSDTYGHIMRTPMPEIDMRDVFLNRRILVVLLPALEKSPQELTNLGRIIVAALKSTMAVGIGSEVEGVYKKIIGAKPTTSNTPFICVLDEYGYYAVKGFAVVPAQARSLGFSACFAGQDLPGFEKSGKEEAESTIGNTTTKLCGKLECVRTFEFFDKIASEGYFNKRSGTESVSGTFGSSDVNAKHTAFDRVRRINITELQKLDSGQWYIFRSGKIIKSNSFYTDLDNFPIEYVRTNHFLRVPRMDVKTAKKWTDAFDATRELLTSDEHESMSQEGNFSTIIKTFKNHQDGQLGESSAWWMASAIGAVCNQDDSSYQETQEMLADGGSYADISSDIYSSSNATDLFSEALNGGDDGLDKLSAIMTSKTQEEAEDVFQRHHRPIFSKQVDEPDLDDNQMNAFAQPIDDLFDDGDSTQEVKPSGRARHERNLLDRKRTQSSIEAMSILTGANPESAKQYATEATEEISQLSRYPTHKPLADTNTALNNFASNFEQMMKFLGESAKDDE